MFHFEDVPIPELEEIMQLTIDFNLTNVELGKTFKALGSLASTTNIDEQQSEEGTKRSFKYFGKYSIRNLFIKK